MTLLDSPSELKVASVSEETPAAERGAGARRRDRGIVAIALVALAIVVVGWVTFELFEGPVARAWYSTRQHQRGSAFSADRSHTGSGAAIGVLQIPRLGVNVIVADGATAQELRGGPAHETGTPLPGDTGNSVVVGHAGGWGGPFGSLHSLQVKDLIVVQTHDPATGGLRNAVFRVVSVQRATASDVTPFGGSTDRRLTLVTGAGGQFSDRRLVVVAVSGTVGKAVVPGADVSADVPGGSKLWNAQMLLALVGIGGALLVGLAMRRRYSAGVAVVAALPLLALGLLGLLLNLDLFLAALR